MSSCVMYEELVDSLRFAEDTLVGDNAEPYKKLLLQAADAIEELHKESYNLSQNFEVLRRTNEIQGEQISIYESVLPRWISVKERLPKAEYGESESVLTVDELGCMCVAYFDGGCWCHPTGEVIETIAKFKITHWMPLPVPPKEKTDA